MINTPDLSHCMVDYLLKFDIAHVVILAFVGGLYHMWRRHAVKSLVPLPGPVSKSFIFGNSRDLYSAPNGLDYHHGLFRKYGNVFKVNMMAGEEQIYLSDTRALQHVLVKDTHIFDETPAMMSEFYYCFGPGLISVHGDTHKKQRKMIQPLFGTSHMRNLTPTFWKVAAQTRDVILAKVLEGSSGNGSVSACEGVSAVIDVWRWCSRVALEGVGVGALGYSFGALDDSVDSDYMIAARELPYTVYPLRKFMPICIWCMKNLPVWLQRFLAKITPVPRVQKVRRIVETLQRTSDALWEEKKRIILEDDLEKEAQLAAAGNDVLSVLMRANMSALENEKEYLPEEEVKGQINTLVSAAHDTVSSAIGRMLFALSQDAPRQERLRKELIEASGVSEDFTQINYHTVTTLPFLDACYRETLRLYAPASFQHRIAKKATVVPLREPITLANGEVIKELPINKDQTVFVGIETVNRDPEIWGPDAEQWIPERWIEGIPHSVNTASVPGAFSNTLTFLGGNRSCIGMKFSEIEIKTVLFALIRDFQFGPAPGKEEIKWRLSLVQTPALPGREHIDEPELPLKVTLMNANVRY
ncbi:cytochrome P450 [Dendrothele bispora CBS 962.96]|uniref:Cytochrome P450 n=1 Tax=Dendrothele bispora (strain CBS 962.96) TaxID=1314807 RepID=A0A4S8L498_DENBC|nr:cytochrome P450 [Dendrothele bispora CBS 962.96]